MNQEERERLARIRRANQRERENRAPEIFDDIDFLLSQLDSQAAKGDAADRGINKLLLASDLTAEAYKKGWSDAATQMRDAYVERVKLVAQQHREMAEKFKGKAIGEMQLIRAEECDILARSLESLTLKEQPK